MTRMRETDSFMLVLIVMGLVLALGIGWFIRSHEAPRSSLGSWWVEGGDAERGKASVLEYGCGSCHIVPGIRQADGTVGPALTRLGQQQYIAGEIPNTPGNLVRWIRDPQHIAPGTAMPDLGVTEADARDIAAYLYASGD